MKATMPVILANPSRRGRKRRKRKNSGRRRARGTRKNASGRKRRKRKNPSRGRRRAGGRRRRNNPSGGWGDAVVDVFLGFLGGGVGVVAAKGSEMLPIAPVWQIAILVGAGLIGATAIAKWGSVAAAAGLGGAVAGLGIARGVEIYALSVATKEARAALPGGTTEGAALFDARFRDAGAVTRRAPPVGVSMASNPIAPGRVMTPEAGYNRRFTVPAGTRLMGPRSWVNQVGRDAGTVVRVRSAHNS